MLDEPEVLKTIKAGYKSLGSVICLYEEQILISGETDIKCFDIFSVLLKTTKTKSKEMPNDIAVYKDGALMYSD